MKIILFSLSILFFANSFGQKNDPPALSSIREQDIKADLYEHAGAKFRGRGGGSIDELKAAAWLAEKYRSIGLKPAGDDGTYFQYFTLWRNRISDNSSVQINNRKLELWKDAMITQPANITINAPVVYLGDASTMDTLADIKGKVVAVVANAQGINLKVSLPTWRYNGYIMNRYGNALQRRGAAAIIFIADATGEWAWADAAQNAKNGRYDIDGGANVNVTTTVPVIWVHANETSQLQNNATLHTNLIVSKFAFPSVNVIGVIEGTDAKLKKEYLLYSGHTDAHGIRNVINNDSIYYGADDNASVNVAMLANARAFVKKPAKRSVLFVIHGSEERGLLGSRYFTQHPTVPLQMISAVLNGDMIGRNDPDSATFLGMLAPHRNSVALVNMALTANNEGPKFKLDTTWDSPKHIEGWYFRSDHLPYARLGIPAIMYTTLLHPDYHTPSDNAENINYPKLKKMADWMYRTGWKVANADMKLTADKDFKLER
jgi:hypothetical protein